MAHEIEPILLSIYPDSDPYALNEIQIESN